MKIEQRSLMGTPLGLFGALLIANNGIAAAWVVDNHITVLQRADGSFSFKDHTTDKEPAKEVQEQIIKEIMGDK